MPKEVVSLYRLDGEEKSIWSGFVAVVPRVGDIIQHQSKGYSKVSEWEVVRVFHTLGDDLREKQSKVCSRNGQVMEHEIPTPDIEILVKPFDRENMISEALNRR